ncbi:hypothetical protein H5410_014567 [Solanum commersonii]|uniref:Uncharacterized protein n=1 Tax=Solanum commersonii TaxID=4109 RepID=A0A9J5ZRU4_SOLCO|nr:hypothetical protein H5410_014567 [Solanum commersonii]
MNGAIYIEKGMLFNSKKHLQRAVKLLHLKIARAYFVIKSTKKSWQLVCRRVEQGSRFRLTSFNDKHTNMWKDGKYIKEHKCDMGTCHDGHFNLDVEMIANVLRVDIEKTPRFSIKDCQTAVLKAYDISISRIKAYLDRTRAFEKIYGTWEGSFAELPRFMEALKHFNSGTIVEWKTERRVNVIEDTFERQFSKIKIKCHFEQPFMGNCKSLSGEKSFEKNGDDQEINPKAYVWLMKNDLDKWTLHKDGGRRWGMLTTNSSESFNGLLKSARGLPVTAMDCA